MSILIKSDEKNQDVKDQILQAAKKLFAQQGFSGTSVRQICEEANVSLALVSYHFDGKDNVFYSIFEPLNQFFTEMKFDLTDSRESLHQFIRLFVLYRYEEHELITILQQELMMKSPRLDRLTPVIMPSWDDLRSILEACKEQGIIDYPSIDFAVNFIMGTLIFSMPNSFVNQYDRMLQENSPDHVAELAISFITQGLNMKK
ncbi:MAG: TetR/AcrR family transcriptional regulator [Candidatus Pristimantibacillus sp.]